MRPPIEHVYQIDGQPYRLREATMLDGQQRIMQAYALALTLMPGTLHPETGLPLVYQESLWAGYTRTLEGLQGGVLYARAVIQECLVEAPDFWWLPQPVAPGQNGTTRRVVTFKDVTVAVWQAHVPEVNAFLEAIFQADQREAERLVAPGPAEPDMVAAAQTLSPLLRGRAE